MFTSGDDCACYTKHNTAVKKTKNKKNTFNNVE